MVQPSSSRAPTAPVISCVIPVFNGMRVLNRAVNSVLAQRPDVQVVLVDDDSTDGTREFVLELARNDPRIAAVVLPENRGQGNARNIGVAATKSSYVTFLDQDDEHVPGWYDYALEVLEKNPVHAAIKGAIEFMDVPADLDFDPADPRGVAITDSVMWNVVTRKVVYQTLGGCPVSRHNGEDIGFVLNLRKHCTLVTTDYPSTRHYLRSNNATTQYLRRTRAVGTRVEFLETHAAERDGTLAKELLDFQSQADRNVTAVRTLFR